jgi:hypothetical protein
MMKPRTSMRNALFNAAAGSAHDNSTAAGRHEHPGAPDSSKPGRGAKSRSNCATDFGAS